MEKHFTTYLSHSLASSSRRGTQVHVKNTSTEQACKFKKGRSYFCLLPLKLACGKVLEFVVVDNQGGEEERDVELEPVREQTSPFSAGRKLAAASQVESSVAAVGASLVPAPVMEMKEQQQLPSVTPELPDSKESVTAVALVL